MRIWDMVDAVYKTFDFSLKVRLSFHDPDNMDKYLSTPEVWQAAEKSLRELAEEREIEVVEAPGEAAMYGPKLDFMATDSIGREHQVATIQLDFIMPERFELYCVNEQGEHESIVMIHSALMGSFERFVAVILEHLGGNLPLWLSPVQVKVVPIAEAHLAYATEVHEALLKAGIRSELDSVDDSLGKRIRACKVNKLPHFVCIGDSELEARSAKLESRSGDSKDMRLDELIAHLTAKIQTRARE